MTSDERLRRILELAESDRVETPDPERLRPRWRLVSR